MQDYNYTEEHSAMAWHDSLNPNTPDPDKGYLTPWLVVSLALLVFLASLTIVTIYIYCSIERSKRALSRKYCSHSGLLQNEPGTSVGKDQM